MKASLSYGPEPVSSFILFHHLSLSRVTALLSLRLLSLKNLFPPAREVISGFCPRFDPLHVLKYLLHVLLYIKHNDLSLMELI